MTDQKRPLVEYRILAYNKTLVTEAMQQGAPIVLSGVFQEAGIKNQNGRIYPREILEREIQKFQDAIRENRAYGALDHPDCLRESAKILTEDGWKFIKDVSDNENVATLNRKTGKIEYQHITRKIGQPYSGEMYALKSKNIDTVVTPNHRFWVYDRNGVGNFKTAEFLYNELETKKNLHLSIPKTATWDGADINEYTISGVNPSRWKRLPHKLRKKYAEDVIIDAETLWAFVGIYLAEGCISKRRGNEVRIYQTTPNKKKKIKELLDKMPFQWKEHRRVFTTHDARLQNFVSQFGDDCYTKHLTPEFKNASTNLLDTLFEWFLLGDGTTISYLGYVRKKVFSTSKKLIDDLHEVLLKTGNCGRQFTQTSNEDYLFADHIIRKKNKNPLFMLGFDTGRNVYIHRTSEQQPFIQKIDFSGMVYCVSVPNEVFYCMDEGKCFWSGNSSIVELSNAAVLIKELGWQGNQVLGKLEVLNTHRGKDLQACLEAGGAVGISSRAFGSTHRSGDGTEIVNEDLSLITFDTVASPSVAKAILSESLVGFPPKPIDRDAVIHEILDTIIRIYK